MVKKAAFGDYFGAPTMLLIFPFHAQHSWSSSALLERYVSLASQDSLNATQQVNVHVSCRFGRNKTSFTELRIKIMNFVLFPQRVLHLSVKDVLSLTKRHF